MAGEATIGALRVTLGADTAKFEDNLKSAIGSLEDFGKKVATIATGVGIEKAFEKAFGAVVNSITHAIDAADKLAKASQKFGIPVETLSALSDAASLSDVSLEQLGSSLSKMAKSAVAAQAPTSEQASALRALGVSAQSFIKLNAEDRILTLADAFAQFQDGPAKTAAAVALFGRAGADMIPFLDQGASGIKTLTDRFKDLGIVISSETAAAAEKYNDDLKTLAIAKDAIILKILGSSGMLTAMTELTAAMVDAAGKSSKLADSLGSALGGSLQQTTKFLQEARDNAAGLVSAWGNLKTAWSDFANAKNAEGMAKLGDALRDVGIMTTEEAARLKDAHDQLAIFKVDFSSVNDALERYLKLTGTKPNLPFDPNADKITKAFNDELAKLHDKTLDISGVFAGQLAPGFLAATATMEALKGQIKITGDTLVTLGPQAQQFNDAMLKLQGTQLALSLQDPWPKFASEIPAMTAALEAAGYTADQVAALIEKAAERANVSWKTAVGEILANATTAFVGLAQKNKEFAGIAKGLSIAQATFSAYEAFNKALATYPPPFNFVGASVALAAGLATVAKIVATPFAKGGSFTVPGGMSGTDTHMVPLALASGEQVDITPASQVSRGGGRSREFIVGMSMQDFLSGSNMRTLIESMNSAERDGYRLKFVER